LPFALVAAACGGGSAATFLSIATGGTGGVYYPYGGAIARVLTESLPGVQATAEVTGASVDNLKLMQLGRVDLAFTLADTLAEALAGTGSFQSTGAIGTIRTVVPLYTNFTHVVARQGSGIRTVADLRGKTVSVGSPGSGTELIADRVMSAAGLDPRADITRHTLGVAESAGALKDGKVDAFIWSGGVPTPALQDLAATPGLTMALLAHGDLLPLLERNHGRGLYRAAVIPAGSYRGVEADTAVVGVTNVLVASSSLDEALVYDIVRVLFERKDALVAAHPEARHLAVPPGAESSPAPFHPGAVRYFRDHGWQK
jgi:TRAP transporter TAXI family solute receptor